MTRPDKKSTERVKEVIKEERKYLTEHEAPVEVIERFDILKRAVELTERELDLRYK